MLRRQRVEPNKACGLAPLLLEVLGAAAKLEADIEWTIAERRGLLIDRANDSIARFEAAKQCVSVDGSTLCSGRFL